MEEIYKRVADYPDYEVSNFGNVRSWKRKMKGKTLKTSIHYKGYICVCLSNTFGRKSIKIHRLVASAFIPNVLGLPEVNHKDNTRDNNFADNLEWCSSSYNSKYAFEKGTRNNSGKNAKHKKLTEHSVKEIRAMYRAGGITMKTLADKHSVRSVTISKIVNNKTWTYL